jgi:hypothetical protein
MAEAGDIVPAPGNVIKVTSGAIKPVVSDVTMGSIESCHSRGPGK